MFKKLMLIIATLAVISVAFAIYQWREEPIRISRPPAPPSDNPVLEPRPRSTQPVARIEEKNANFNLGEALKIPPGTAPNIFMYDPKTGEAKYILNFKEWERVSDNELAMVQPNARVLLPSGQLAYVRADAGRLVFHMADGKMEPKRGEFKGNVRIILERTDFTWRQLHTELPDVANAGDSTRTLWPMVERRVAELGRRFPSTVATFWLDDVRFDLELAQLFSNGPIKVESADGGIEGRGLELQWDEATRRILKLRIEQGRQASFRAARLIDLSAEKTAAPAAAPSAAQALAARMAGAQLPATAASAPAADPQTQDPARPTLTFADPDGRGGRPDKDRVDAYRVVFHDNIHAEQHEGDKIVGRLKASLLEVLLELGREEREAVQHVPGSQPARAGTSPARQAKPETPTTNQEPTAFVVLKWTGEVLVLPEETPASRPGGPTDPSKGAAERFQIVATGAPVEMASIEMGMDDARCARMEFHQETEEVWLIGTPEEPVQLVSRLNGDLYGERVYFNRKTGIARVEGPGRLISTRTIADGLQPEADTRANGRAPTEKKNEDQPTILAWQKSAQMEFGQASAAAPDKPDTFTAVSQAFQSLFSGRSSPARSGPNPAAGNPGGPLKRAVFDGQVTLDQAGPAMGAEHVEVTFLPPRRNLGAPKGDLFADRILARGQVRMTGRREHPTDAVEEFFCDALDVEMTVDDTGRNAPKAALARGHVLARMGPREIRATDELNVTFASVPLGKQQIDEKLAAARRNGIAEGSPEWVLHERRLRADRRDIITAITARTDVAIHDPIEQLSVAGDVLDCTLDESRQITKASILGDAEHPAHAQTSDFFIRGPRILMDMANQSAEVPGAGLLRFFAAQEIDGRPVEKPIPVVVSWGQRMVLDGQANVGTFTGQVKAQSQSSTLNCRDLTLRFRNSPKAEETPAAEPGGRLVGSLLKAFRRQESSRLDVGGVGGQWGKRLAQVHAIGTVSIEIKSYEIVPPKGVVAQTLFNALPEWLRRDPANPTAEPPRRLVSGAFITGPRMVIDLIEKHFVVQGAGQLLVRDYRLSESPRRTPGRTGSLLADVDGDSLTGFSPGHTVFEWRNSMSFLNHRNIAVFDSDVVMVHRSGSQLKWTAELASVTGLSQAELDRLKGRYFKLATDNLLVEFQRTAGEPSGPPASLSQATKLRSFRAAGRVHLSEETADSSRSLEGNDVTYNDGTGIVRATGTSRIPVQGMIVNSKTGRRDGPYRGTEIEWNRKTGLIRVPGADITVSGR